MFGKNNYSAADQKRIAELTAQLAESEAREEAQEAEITRLKAEIEQVADETLTIRAAIQKNQRLAKEAETQLAANAEKLATFDAEVEKAAAARFAGLGGDPLPESGGSNTEFSGLTGLAKAQAIHKAQSQKSNPSNQ